MRDIIFLLLLPFMLYPLAKRPFIALGMWIWTAMFFPNAWMYGIASELRYNLIFSGFAIFGYLAWKEKPRIQFGTIGKLVLLFFFWTTLSTTFTLGEPSVAWTIWDRFMKVVLLFVFVILIVDDKLHIDFFFWCLVLSIGFFAGVEGLKFIMSGGGHKIEGFAGHVLGDRNELSIAFVMILPICFYLLNQYGKESFIIKSGLIGLIGLIVISVIGTQSRGGFIALLALGGYLFMKSERKILVAILIVALVCILSSLVSHEWISRMNTIESADKDASFMGRVVAWKLSFIMATKHPILGGGFKSLETFRIWRMLSEDFDAFPFFYTGDAVPNPVMARAAHSVYFQIMGEHGFVGLLIYVSILGISFVKAGRIAKNARKWHAPEWVAHVGTTLQLSIFAFALGGSALSFAYFDLIFALFGLVQVVSARILPRMVKASEAARENTPKKLSTLHARRALS